MQIHERRKRLQLLDGLWAFDQLLKRVENENFDRYHKMLWQCTGCQHHSPLDKADE